MVMLDPAAGVSLGASDVPGLSATERCTSGGGEVGGAVSRDKVHAATAPTARPATTPIAKPRRRRGPEATATRSGSAGPTRLTLLADPPAARSAKLMSLADWNRSSRRFSRQCATMAWTAAGTLPI